MQTKKNHQTKKGANQVIDQPPKNRIKSKIKSSPGKNETIRELQKYNRK